MLSDEEIERGLTDEDPAVRRAFAERTDYTPTKEQVERGLTDDAYIVRWGFAQRADFTPTEEQIERALVDRDGFLWLAFVNWGNNAD